MLIRTFFIFGYFTIMFRRAKFCYRDMPQWKHEFFQMAELMRCRPTEYRKLRNFKLKF